MKTQYLYKNNNNYKLHLQLGTTNTLVPTNSKRILLIIEPESEQAGIFNSSVVTEHLWKDCTQQTFLEDMQQMFDKMFSVSSQNVKTNLLRHVTCLNTLYSHCLHYIYIYTCYWRQS